ncbi:PGC-1 and ERR-induced regulator in muscle protein 1 [Carettochelys insculpta]|uniref:PGC-1 and ERR-induced regulator in muscle protein 1 n=1 Tax=Carettochelys insculpta TaxID=44489 RepID=UPI003EBC2E90
MENFEYSIQRNDRDWAEFYLASEECSLSPAALASADEQGFSDTDPGDNEDGSHCLTRLITVRAGDAPAPGTGRSPLCGVPGESTPPWPLPGHLVLEEVLSGSEDETDLGSVSRFLCEGKKRGTLQQTLLRPGAPGRRLPHFSGASCAVEKPLLPQDSPHKESGQAAEHAMAASFAVQAGGGLPDGAPRDGEQLPDSSEMAEHERPVHTMDVSLPAWAASEGLERPAGVQADWSGCLEDRLSDPNSDISQTPAAAPLQPTCSRIQGDSHPAGEPSGACWRLEQAWMVPGSPAASPRVMQPVHQGESWEHKRTPAAEATLLGTLAPESSTPALGFLTPSALLHESKGDGIAAKLVPRGLEGEDEAHQCGILACDILGDEGRGSALGAQAVITPRSKGVEAPSVQPLSGEVKKTGGARPKQATDSGERETVSSAHSSKPTASQGKECAGPTGRALRLGNKVASAGDAEDRAQSRQRPGLLRGTCSFPAAAEGSQEGAIPALSWPEMYDYFFCDTQEQWGEKDNLGGVTQTPPSPSEKEQEVPEMSGPEMYEYFFNEPEGSRGGGGRDTFVASDRGSSSSLEQTASQCESREEPGSGSVISIPEVYEHFFTDGARGRRGWGEDILSMPAWEARKAMGAMKSLLRKPMHLVRRCLPSHRALGLQSSTQRLPLRQRRPSARTQLKPEDLGMAPALAERPHPPLALTQEDLCLVFVAFASWAVKTSNLQAPDAWKTVLLANFGTLSAIRYFRQRAIEGRLGPSTLPGGPARDTSHEPTRKSLRDNTRCISPFGNKMQPGFQTHVSTGPPGKK